jgi:hypothetical protein
MGFKVQSSSGRQLCLSSAPNWIVQVKQVKHHRSGFGGAAHNDNSLNVIHGTSLMRAPVIREEVCATDPPRSSLSWEIIRRIFKSKPDARVQKNLQARPQNRLLNRRRPTEEDFSPRITLFRTFNRGASRMTRWPGSSSVFSGLTSCADDSEGEIYHRTTSRASTLRPPLLPRTLR